MKWQQRFNQVFGFTKNESRIVLFLVSTFLIGTLLKYWNVSFHHHPQFDYSAPDSIFYARSAQAGFYDTVNVAQVLDSTNRIQPKQLKGDSLSRIINLNTATKEDFIRLPGIGESMAERILAYRKAHGRFQSIKELRNVKGIGVKKMERLTPFVKAE